MILLLNSNKCHCLKNRSKQCKIQCNNPIFINNVCKKHSKSTFKMVKDYNLIIMFQHDGLIGLG